MYRFRPPAPCRDGESLAAITSDSPPSSTLDSDEGGCARLDNILNGGFPRGRLHLIEGDPGAGKTTLAMQFTREGVTQGERALYVYTVGVASDGIAELDALTGGGLDRGTSTLLIGPAGCGKTSIALQWAATAAKRGEGCAFFTFEEAPRLC